MVNDMLEMKKQANYIGVCLNSKFSKKTLEIGNAATMLRFYSRNFKNQVLDVIVNSIYQNSRAYNFNKPVLIKNINQLFRLLDRLEEVKYR